MTEPIWDQLAAIGKSAPGAWDELPPLPQGAVYTPALGTVGAAIYTFTADQMRAYAAAAVARERERIVDAAVERERTRCIKKIEAYQIPIGNSSAGEMAAEWTMDALREIRDAIRKGG